MIRLVVTHRVAAVQVAAVAAAVAGGHTFTEVRGGQTAGMKKGRPALQPPAAAQSLTRQPGRQASVLS